MELIPSSSRRDVYRTETETGTEADPFGYNAQSGYNFDRETGLYACMFRYYDPARGRWLNRDPISYSGGINLYGYCGSTAVGVADPNGLGWGRVIGGLVGGIGAGAAGFVLSGGNPLAAWAAGAAGTAGGSYLGGLLDGEDPATAGKNALMDGAISGIAGPILGKCFSWARGLRGARGAMGRAASNIGRNRESGLRAQEEALQNLRAQGRNIGPGRYQRAPGYRNGRLYDGEELYEAGNIIAHIEVKSGSSWYGGLQKAKDEAIERLTGIPTIVIRWPVRP